MKLRYAALLLVHCLQFATAMQVRPFVMMTLQAQEAELLSVEDSLAVDFLLEEMLHDAMAAAAVQGSAMNSPRSKQAENPTGAPPSAPAVLPMLEVSTVVETGTGAAVEVQAGEQARSSRTTDAAAPAQVYALQHCL